jgi:hypothetical protein
VIRLRNRTGTGAGDERYQQARARARHRPSWWLRRRDRRITARRPPDAAELVELVAIRQELKLRAMKPCRRVS